MTAQAALKTALKDLLGPAARAHGYRGSVPSWRKTNAAGDWVVINVQSSSWSTSDRLDCVVNIAAAPEPWLRWTQQRLGTRMPKSVNESLGVYRDRLHPTGTPPGVDGWWEITDQASASDAVTDMNVRLEDAGWSVLDSLLSREGLMRRIEQGDLGHMKRSNFEVYFARAKALLLMDEGPSDALESSLEAARDNTMPTQRTNADQFDSWVREQARTRRNVIQSVR